MTQVAKPEGEWENPHLSNSDFSRIAAFARKLCGLNIEGSKMPLVQSRLSRRLKNLGLSDYTTYLERLENGDVEECEQFVSAITTNVTHFYRELHHFEHFETQLVRPLLDRARQGGRVRIWSAGCSSGQEPYSIAGALLAADANVSRWDVRILATDIDRRVLARAEAGVYDTSEAVFPDLSLEKRVLLPATSGKRHVQPALKDLISFRTLNLIANWPFSGKFDVIFCRNVAIYFDKRTQATLWSRFVSHLAPSGTLFIGHSERIPDPEALGLRCVGTTTYRGVSGPETLQEGTRTWA